ncbi:hypothetical protein Zm00014a_029177 [Zea mays]|uniref:Uncharacterized protein n=2 Tax=Zea mays TaxID=4577 RepID=A0A3L6DDX1_MAIZE|nr:hypothetical protein Zm00014a_029177 [Zea mays]
MPVQNSSLGSPPHRVLRSICAVPTHAVALVFGDNPCRVVDLRSSTVYASHFAGSAQAQHRRRSPRRGTPCFAWRRRQVVQRSSTFEVMRKSESPSSLQTPIGLFMVS